LHALRRFVQLRHGRWRQRAVLVYGIAAGGGGAAGSGRLLVSGLSARSYCRAEPAPICRTALTAQRWVRKKRIISRLASGPLPSV
jgi:hypothetical protein